MCPELNYTDNLNTEHVQFFNGDCWTGPVLKWSLNCLCHQKLLVTKLLPISESSNYYSNPLIHLYPRMHKSSNVAVLKDWLLLHSEHSPKLFSHFWNRVHVLLLTLFGLIIPTRDNSSLVLFKTIKLKPSAEYIPPLQLPERLWYLFTI
jgi:hypothetical protein